MKYIVGMDFDGVVNDRKTYSVVIREFEIISEAVKYLQLELTDKHQKEAGF